MTPIHDKSPPPDQGGIHDDSGGGNPVASQMLAEGVPDRAGDRHGNTAIIISATLTGVSCGIILALGGRLGIVLDNPGGGLPVVHAIDRTSALRGEVLVGDMLLSVDEVDCRGMSCHDVSMLLGSRSQNAVRTLVLARGSAISSA